MIGLLITLKEIYQVYNYIACGSLGGYWNILNLLIKFVDCYDNDDEVVIVIH